MRLSLYRRHRLECEAKALHPEDSRTYEADEKRKGYKGRCRCLIHVSGTLNGKRVRQSTNTTDWDEARAVAGGLETGSSVIAPPAEPVPARPRVSVSEACADFITNRESRQVAPATLRKYVTFVKQLTAYADSRGYLLIEQWQPRDVDLFYASLKLAPRTKGKRLGVLRAFFRFCVNRKWISETPVSADVKAPVGSSRSADKMPFDDEEISRILAACDNPPRPLNQRDRSPGQVGCAYRNDQGDGEWTGEDLKDLIQLMLHTGFRISDATLFDMSRLRGNEIMIRAQKNGNHVFAWVPDSVRDRLRARAKLHGDRPFIGGRSKRLETVTNVWRRRIQHAFDAAGEFSQPPTPHRFRHTFARILLARGVSVADVAELMGDDEETIRIHYAAWVVERQQRLTRVLRDAFTEESNPTA